jgi:hypothetical protein
VRASLSQADDSNGQEFGPRAERISQMPVGKGAGDRTLAAYPLSCPAGGHGGAIFRVRAPLDSPASGWLRAFVASIGVFVVTSSRGAEYRRRARACLDAARATQNEATRAALFRLAEDWQRMAEGWDDPARRAAAGHARPVVQQQQQVQPKKK